MLVHQNYAILKIQVNKNNVVVLRTLIHHDDIDITNVGSLKLKSLNNPNE